MPVPPLPHLARLRTSFFSLPPSLVPSCCLFPCTLSPCFTSPYTHSIFSHWVFNAPCCCHWVFSPSRTCLSSLLLYTLVSGLTRSYNHIKMAPRRRFSHYLTLANSVGDSM